MGSIFSCYSEILSNSVNCRWLFAVGYLRFAPVPLRSGSTSFRFCQKIPLCKNPGDSARAIKLGIFVTAKEAKIAKFLYPDTSFN
jgi:hypothetical protein